MLVLTFLLTAIYAFTNVFGAWAVIRRKSYVAALFMLAAVVLVVAAAALISAIPFTRVLLAMGLLLASLASYVNARIVIGKVFWRNHFIRALVAVMIYLIALAALR